MPKLWSETIEGHRQLVREAILDKTAALVAKRGPLSVTMSEVAEASGIGRATLYKYFPDVEAILGAWHERQVAHHLKQLADVRDQTTGGSRLRAVLETYALTTHRSRSHADRELVEFLHTDPRLARAQQRLRDLISGLLADGARTGSVRDDVSPEELASYCLNAIGAASSASSERAAHRIVNVILAGLQPDAPKRAKAKPSQRGLALQRDRPPHLKAT